MLKNFWWPIGFSAEFTPTPKTWRALNQDFVIYRQPNGAPVVLHDACARCNTPLSLGQLEGAHIVCRKDGWTYQPDGRCVRAPADAHSAPAWVDGYPAQDRYGWLFAFLGDLPEADRIPIPELPYLVDSQFKKIYGKFNWNVHYARALENGVDAAHTPFVHGGAFGNPDEPEIEEYEVETVGDYSARATIHLTPQPSKGLWRFLYQREKKPVTTLVQWWLPNLSLLEIHLPMGKLFIYNAHVPIDDFHTISHYTALRTFFTANWADADAHRRVIAIFSQDKKVVEAQRPELLPFDLGAELHVKSDAIQIAFRKTRQNFFDRGWNIGGHARPDHYIIPSPIRRELLQTA